MIAATSGHLFIAVMDSFRGQGGSHGTEPCDTLGFSWHGDRANGHLGSAGRDPALRLGLSLTRVARWPESLCYSSGGAKRLPLSDLKSPREETASQQRRGQAICMLLRGAAGQWLCSSQQRNNECTKIWGCFHRSFQGE